MTDQEAWHEYVCSDEPAARREAEKQTAEDPEGAEWIYLRDKQGRWVARRIHPGWVPTGKGTWKEAIAGTLGELLNPFGWMGP